MTVAFLHLLMEIEVLHVLPPLLDRIRVCQSEPGNYWGAEVSF